MPLKELSSANLGVASQLAPSALSIAITSICVLRLRR
jgi:hypothetical protein